MKEFNGEKFCKDIIELRGTDSQSAFAAVSYTHLSDTESEASFETGGCFGKK